MSRFLVAAVCFVFSGFALAADKPDVPALVKQLQSKSRTVRLKAIEAIGDAGKDARQADRPLMEAMVREYPSNRTKYLDCLEKINPTLSKPVVTILVDNDAGAHKSGSISHGNEGRCPRRDADLWASVSKGQGIPKPSFFRNAHASNYAPQGDGRHWSRRSHNHSVPFGRNRVSEQGHKS